MSAYHREMLSAAVAAAMLGVLSCAPVKKTDADSTAVSTASAAVPPPAASEDVGNAGSTSTIVAPAQGIDVSAAADTRSTQAEYYPGRTPAIRDRSPPAITSAETGEVTLNFQNADLQEVINVILGDMLKVNYTVDPKVRGTVTVQTSRPLAKAELLPTLESFLAMNGAVMVRGDGVYRILPLAGAERMAGRAGAEAGYGIRIVPLKYISATEMQNILQPLIGEGAALRVDERHNLVLLRGTGEQLDNLVDTVETFDVDWLRGMSVGLFTLRHAEAKVLADEVKQLFGTEDSGLYKNLLRIVPIERLNAVLVISPQQTYVHEAGQWITRLDRPSEQAGQRLYVYRAQNSRAADLAAVLASVLSPQGQSDSTALTPLGIAPGETPAIFGDPGYTRTLTAPDAADVAAGAPIPEPIDQSLTVIPPLQPGTSADSTQPPFSADIVLPRQTEAIRVIADEAHNSVVILATTEQYKMIEQALKQLDVLPLQVLIEASIVEVTLTDSLQYGVEWLFRNRFNEDFVGTGKLDLGAAGLNAVADGFSYAITGGAGEIRAVLNLLAQDSRLNVLSTPSLMVLDNQQAIIQVGNEIPITVQQQQSTVVGGTGTAPIINSIQYRNTGVILAVTPRVNASGLITMDVAQEVSDVAGAATLTPTILQRKIASTVAVQSGETIVLGGLIRDNKNNTERGVPGLYKVPVLGKLFGNTQRDTSRTELLVVITPRAVSNQHEARQVTDEMRSKLRGLPPIDTSAGYPPAPVSKP